MPALVQERADRPEDLFEVLARAALVDPHRADSGPRSSGAGRPVEQAAILRAPFADPEEPRMAASVTSGSGDQQGTSTTSAASGEAVPVSALEERAGAADRSDGRPGTAPAGRPSIHHVQRHEQADRLDRVGQHGRAGTRRPSRGTARPATRLRVGPRFLAGLEADRRHEDADGDDRRRGRATIATTSSGQSTRPASNGDAEEDDADGERDERAHAAHADAGHAAAEQHDQEVARADVDVLEHPVALAVVEDRPGEAGDARHARTTTARCRRRRSRGRRGRPAAADDLDHQDEDERAEPAAWPPSR